MFVLFQIGFSPCAIHRSQLLWGQQGIPWLPQLPGPAQLPKVCGPDVPQPRDTRLRRRRLLDVGQPAGANNRGIQGGRT